MKSEDMAFKKECQKIHSRIKALLRKNKIDEASKLLNQMGERASEWEEYDRSVRFKSRFIRSLHAELTRSERVKRASLNQETKNESK